MHKIYQNMGQRKPVFWKKPVFWNIHAHFMYILVYAVYLKLNSCSL